MADVILGGGGGGSSAGTIVLSVLGLGVSAVLVNYFVAPKGESWMDKLEAKFSSNGSSPGATPGSPPAPSSSPHAHRKQLASSPAPVTYTPAPMPPLVAHPAAQTLPPAIQSEIAKLPALAQIVIQHALTQETDPATLTLLGSQLTAAGFPKAGAAATAAASGSHVTSGWWDDPALYGYGEDFEFSEYDVHLSPYGR